MAPRCERVITAGSDVYIRWTASGSLLGATPVTLFFTTDDTNYTQLATGLTNGQNTCSSITGSGSASGSATGCYKWAAGSPTSTYFKIRVSATNSYGSTSFGNSSPLNSSSFQILAGNTETGINGAANSGIFQSQYNTNGWVDAQSVVVNSKGTVYFRDINQGLLTVSPTDGILRQLIPLGATSSGDGGNISSAKLRSPVSIAIDGSDRLLIFDYDRIRRVDFSTSPASITTIIGGGSSTTDSVSVGTNLKFTASAGSYVGVYYKFPMIALPNGDIYFFSDSFQTFGTKRLRIYSGATHAVASLYISGSSSTVSSIPYGVTDYTKCGLQMPAFEFDPATSTVSKLFGVVAASSAQNGCFSTNVSSGTWSTMMKFDLSTGIVDNSIVPSAYLGLTSNGAYNAPSTVQSLDGQIYFIDRNTYYLTRYNSSTNTWTKIIGNGTRGGCADGTAALSCAIDPGGAFVDAQGHAYFVDRGRIRTVVNGNIVTLFGQSVDYGDGGLATNARFGLNVSIAERSDSRIIVHDILANKIRMFSRGQNVVTIAGNGTYNYSSALSAAVTQPLPSQAQYAAFYLDNLDNLYYNVNGVGIRELPASYASDSATAWNVLTDSASHNWFSGSTSYSAAANTGSFAGALTFNLVNDYRLLGSNGTSLLYFADKYSGGYYDGVYGEFNTASGAYSMDMGPGTGNTAFCADGTSLASCASSYIQTIPATYDAASSLWLILNPDSKTVRTFGTGKTGTLQTSTTFANAASSFTFKRFASYNSHAYYYYCSISDGRVYLRDADSAREVPLNWPISVCQMYWQPTRLRQCDQLNHRPNHSEWSLWSK